jgi:hypothetical protein
MARENGSCVTQFGVSAQCIFHYLNSLIKSLPFSGIALTSSLDHSKMRPPAAQRPSGRCAKVTLTQRSSYAGISPGAPLPWRGKK